MKNFLFCLLLFPASLFAQNKFLDKIAQSKPDLPETYLVADSLSYPMYRERYTWQPSTNSWQLANKFYSYNFDTLCRIANYMVSLDAQNDTSARYYMGCVKYADSTATLQNYQVFSNGAFYPAQITQRTKFNTGKYPFFPNIDVKKADSNGVLRRYWEEKTRFNAMNFPIAHNEKHYNVGNLDYENEVRFSYDSQNRLDSMVSISKDSLGTIRYALVQVFGYQANDSCPKQIINYDYDVPTGTYYIRSAQINMVWQNCVAGNYDGRVFDFYSGRLKSYNEFNENGDSALVINNYTDGLIAVSREVYPIKGNPTIYRYSTITQNGETINLVEEKNGAVWTNKERDRAKIMNIAPRYPYVYYLKETWLGNVWSVPDSIENNSYTYVNTIDLQQVIDRRKGFSGNMEYFRKNIYGNFIHLLPALATHAPLVGSTSIYPTPATHELVVERSAGSPPAAATLYDLWGRVVLATTLTQPRSQLGVGELPSGFYVLRIAGEGRSYKVVVQH